jgi:hypothetical protein
MLALDRLRVARNLFALMTPPTATTTALPALTVRLVPGRGRCVFAAQDIEKGTRVLADPIIFVPKAESQHTDACVVGRYVFEWNDDGDLCVVLGIGSLINHGLPVNVRLDSNEEDRTMDFFAVRDIAAGEELVYDYGHDAAELATYYGIPTHDGRG